MATLTAPPSKSTELVAGWRVLLACTLGIASGIIAVPFYTNALFFPELGDEFGWTPASLSLVVLVYNLAWAALMPVAGRLVDRFGTRSPALVSGLCLAAGYLALSQTGASILAYGAIVVVTMLAAVATGPIAYSRAIGHTFDKMRGLALGITLAGSGVTAVIAPQLLGPVIQDMGWRAGYLTLAVAVLVVTIAVFVIMPPTVRTGAVVADGSPSPRVVIPARQILRDPIFLRLSAAFVCMALAVAGLVIHLYPMMLDAGVAEDNALWVQSSLGFSVVAGRLISGYFFDRVFAPYVAGTVMALGAVGLATLTFGGPSLAIVAALAVGFCLGAEVDMIALLVSRYFALEVFGQVYGLTYSAFTLGLAASPYVLGQIVTHTDGYVPTISFSVVLLAVTMAIFFTLPRYTQPRLAVTGLTPGSTR